MSHPPATALPSRKLAWALRFFCVVALAISGYLAWSAFQQSEVYGCGGGEVWDCGHVLHSRWAKWFEMPVSVPAAVMYFAVLVALAVCTMASNETARQLAWAVVTVGALSAGIAAIWFISIQAFVLKKLCIYCMCAHCCGIVLSAIILWRRPLGKNMTSALSGISVIGACVLIAGQLLSPPQKTYAEERYNTVDFTDNDEGLFALDAGEDNEFLFEPAEEIFAVPSDERASEAVKPVSALPMSGAETQSPPPTPGDDNVSSSEKNKTSLARSLVQIVSRYAVQLADDITAELAHGDSNEPSSHEDPCYVESDALGTAVREQCRAQIESSAIALDSEAIESRSSHATINDDSPVANVLAGDKMSSQVNPDERQQGLDEIHQDLTAMGVGVVEETIRKGQLAVDPIDMAEPKPQTIRQSAQRLKSILIKDAQSSATVSSRKQSTPRHRATKSKPFGGNTFDAANGLVVHDVLRSDPAPTMTPTPGESSKAAATTNTRPAATRQPSKRNLVAVLGGRAKLDARHWPMVGATDADFVLVELFDYTCPHCRKMNQHIVEARRRYGEQFSIMALPVPLSRECNDTVQSTKLRHQAACELARLAVAVWRINPEAFAVFHDWLFEPEHGRSTAEAWAYASQLVGSDLLQVQMAKPIINQFIAKHVELYKRAGQGTVPKLMFPTVTIRGEMGSADALCEVLERELFNK